MAHRYFTQEIQDDRAYITGADASHLARVLRAKPGEMLVLCDGAGFDYRAEIAAVDRERIELRVVERTPSVGEPGLRAEVFIGLAKGERMDWAVQKAVELGAAGIWPFVSENTIAKPKNPEEKTKRFTRIAHEAAKQCGRGVLPQVHLPVLFREVLEQAAECELPLFFYEEGGRALRQVVAGASGAGSVAIITGPEGGFTPEEAGQAQDAGCITVGLGPRILRCETAPAAALAAVMTLTGNLE